MCQPESAARGDYLGALTRGLIALLGTHGVAELQRAISAALEHGAAHLGGVRHFIDQQRASPSMPLALPDDPRLNTLSVRSHDLADYEQPNLTAHDGPSHDQDYNDDHSSGD